MFLSALADTSKDLGFPTASKDFSIALESILSAANNTNTMIWIGSMENCPLDLSRQGQLLKHGKALMSFLRDGNGRKWSTSSLKPFPSYLFLFSQSIVLCRMSENMAEPDRPALLYSKHIR